MRFDLAALGQNGKPIHTKRSKTANLCGGRHAIWTVPYLLPGPRHEEPEPLDPCPCPCVCCGVRGVYMCVPPPPRGGRGAGGRGVFPGHPRDTPGTPPGHPRDTPPGPQHRPSPVRPGPGRANGVRKRVHTRARARAETLRWATAAVLRNAAVLPNPRHGHKRLLVLGLSHAGALGADLCDWLTSLGAPTVDVCDSPPRLLP